jgi:hypothetical protein
LCPRCHEDVHAEARARIARRGRADDPEFSDAAHLIALAQVISERALPHVPPREIARGLLGVTSA